jgi:hypothetical protein
VRRTSRTTYTQYIQTFQRTVQVGGKAEAISRRNGNLPAQAVSLFGYERALKLTEFAEEMEQTFYLGQGEAPSAGGRTKCKGIKALLPAGNVALPSEIGDEAAYTPLSFIRDVIMPSKLAGGQVDICLISTDWITGLAIWDTGAANAIPVGRTYFGEDIRSFRVPMFGNIEFIEAPLLPAGTAIGLTSGDIYIDSIREEFWQGPRQGDTGDLIEGEWIADMAPDLDNPSHHTWVEGVTGWAKAA